MRIDLCMVGSSREPRPRGHKSTGKGRDQAREASEISFHSLRHSAVTMLKAAGVSDFIAREIVGHESAAASRQYTHLTTDDKRAAMQRLPDVTSALKINQPDVTTNEKP
jgi:integrase